MKSIYAFIALYLPLAAASTNVKELQLSNCHATGKVVSVRDAKYSPGLPPKYRSPGYPAASGFTAQVLVENMTDSCAKLTSKYGLHVVGFSFPAHFSTSPVLQQKAIESFSEGSIGQTVQLDLTQIFGYHLQNGDLPLFPTVHAESMDFEGAATVGDVKMSGSFPLEFNVDWVYGLKPVKSMTGIEKLALAEKTATLLAQKHFAYFEGLFLQLEPAELGLKKSYAELIWSLFHQLKVSTPYVENVLRFHVGGDGSEYGAPLARTFNVISHTPGLFSSVDIQNLILEFPDWILVGGVVDGDCLNFQTSDLEAFLHKTQDKIFLLTPVEKYFLKDPLSDLTGGVLYGFCTHDKLTPTIKSLATSLLQQI